MLNQRRFKKSDIYILVIVLFVMFVSLGAISLSNSNVGTESKSFLAWLVLPKDERESICAGYERFGEQWIRDATTLMVYEGKSELTMDEATVLAGVIIKQCGGG